MHLITLAAVCIAVLAVHESAWWALALIPCVVLAALFVEHAKEKPRR